MDTQRYWGSFVSEELTKMLYVAYGQPRRSALLVFAGSAIKLNISKKSHVYENLSAPIFAFESVCVF
jgi:hypothetical protein